MIRIVTEPFDTTAELAAFSPTDIEMGAVASFIGRVRGSTDAGRLVSLTLEHYPGMAERKLTEIAAEARRRWEISEPLIVHRVGRMVPGDAIVLVATAARHRAAALESCHFLIDWLKTDAPFWKFEETETGGDWVAARESDRLAKESW